MKVVIQGIPYDEKSSFLKGTATAPPRIREILHNGASNYYAENGIDTNSEMVTDLGDFTINDYFDIEKLTIANLLKGERLLTLGGDHSITFPLVKAIRARYPVIDILHIDAHADLYDIYEGDPYSHACPFARIMENKLAKRLVSIGIRTLNTHQRGQAKKFGVEIIEMKEFNKSMQLSFENPVYISIDMDGIDPAFAPGVSHPEPGGFSSRQVINLIHNLDAPIIGADIVEYNPNRDVMDITGSLTAKLMKSVIGKMLAS